MPNHPPYLEELRKRIAEEINRPTPTRDTITRLIQAIPQDRNHAHLSGLVSAREALESALEEDMGHQRQRIGQEVIGLLESLTIPVLSPSRKETKPIRIPTSEAIRRLRDALQRTGETPKSRSQLSAETKLNPSTTKRVLALLVKDGTVEVNKNARARAYRMREESLLGNSANLE